MSGIAISRLSEERKNWRRDHPAGFYARPATKKDGSTDLLVWETGIPGREGILLRRYSLSLCIDNPTYSRRY